MHLAYRRLLLPLLMLGLGLVACDAFRLGSYEIVNESDAPLLVRALPFGCDEPDDTTSWYGQWDVVQAGASETFETIGLMECVEIADVRENVLFAERYSNGRTFTVNNDLTLAATEFTGKGGG